MRLLATALLLPVSCWAAAPPQQPEDVHDLAELGCTGAFDNTALWSGEALRQLPLGDSAVRLALHHPAGRMFIATIDSPTSRFDVPDYRPELVVSIGGHAGTCTMRMPLDECPQASRVREQLMETQVRIGDGMDARAVLYLDGKTYFLEFDAATGRNLLRYNHDGPLQEPVEAALKSLEPCWGPLAEQYAQHVGARCQWPPGSAGGCP